MLEGFRPYGLVHALVVLAAVLGWIVVVTRARRLRDGPRERRFCRAMGWFILATNAAYVGSLWLPHTWNVDVSLPLHLCDFAWMACVWAMMRRALLPRWLIYYWGFGLSWQAFLTPPLDEGPTQFRFWAFWLLHWEIVAVALMETIAFRLRPTWRAFAATCAVTFVLYVGVLGVNLLLGTPYFFNGPSDASVEGTPIALLGPWPQRVVWLGFLVMLLFFFMTLPWIYVRRRGDRRRSPSPTATRPRSR